MLPVKATDFLDFTGYKTPGDGLPLKRMESLLFTTNNKSDWIRYLFLSPILSNKYTFRENGLWLALLSAPCRFCPEAGEEIHLTSVSSPAPR